MAAELAAAASSAATHVLRNLALSGPETLQVLDVNAPCQFVCS